MSLCSEDRRTPGGLVFRDTHTHIIVLGFVWQIVLPTPAAWLSVTHHLRSPDAEFFSLSEVLLHCDESEPRALFSGVILKVKTATKQELY